MALALHSRGIATRLVLPAGSAEEAALVPGAEVYGARHLLDVVRQFLPAGSDDLLPVEACEDGWARVIPKACAHIPVYPDLADVKGQAGAKRALEIAAAGGHSLLMVGPPGSGKSMLAQRFAGLLPAMTVDEALESAAVSSLGGRFGIGQWGIRPTCQPHHSASAVALVGGGSPPRPGEISLAHHGILFLDEFPVGVPARRPGGAARTARDRHHHHRPRRAALRVPGPLPAHRRDEPLPLRLLGFAAQGLPLHAGPDRALPGQAAARCSTASTCTSRCRPSRRRNC
jgi:hypothetical protein